MWSVECVHKSWDHQFVNSLTPQKKEKCFYPILMLPSQSDDIQQGKISSVNGYCEL